MGVVTTVRSPDVLAALRERVAAIAALLDHAAARVVRTGWNEIDEVLPGGGLARAALHEWLVTPLDESRLRGAWRPPLGILIHLAWRALTTGASADAVSTNAPLRNGLKNATPTNTVPPEAASQRCVWVGPTIWPYPVALHAQDPLLLSNSLFLRVCNARQRLSALVTVLQSRAAAVVVADGTGFDLTATRRLQLTAESGSAICLLARPPWERDELSAARTRWLVRPSPAPPDAQRWSVELLRCKGAQSSGSESHRLWTLERRHATRNVVVAADVGD